jgi:hypothetical protein
LHFNTIYSKLLGVGRLRKRTIEFRAGDPVFDLSDGELYSLTYHYIDPKDIRDESIRNGFQTSDPMIKPAGFDLPIPSRKDPKVKISSPVTAAKFYQHLNDARKLFDDPHHQVRCCCRSSF